MKLFAGWRLVVVGLRMAKSLASIATSLETLAQVETERWAKETVRTPVGKKMIFGSLKIDEAEKEWKRRVEGRARDEQ